MEEKWLKKLHTAGRLKELRMQGITKRWVINILGVIALFFVIVFVVSAFTIRAYYYNAVESILNSGASTTATNYFSGRLDGGSSLEASAADFIDSFSYRDKTTIWIINNAGGVVTSSSGFAVEKVRMPDYEEALAGDTGRARYVGHITDNGEKCMAVTRIIYSGDGEPMGAVRVISSLEMIDRQISTIVLLIFLALVLIFAVILYSNLFFIRSIIIPVQEINQTTKKISQGDYSVRIEKKYNDEIGDLADSINQMAEDISATDKMKNDFISIISHELRTPLALMQAQLELFSAEHPDVRPETAEFLTLLREQTERLTQMTKTLLEMSNLQQVARNEQLQLAPMVEEIFTDLAPLAEKRSITLEAEGDAALTGSDALIYRLLFNLTENAVKYNRPGGSVRVELAQGQEKCIIRVSDTGCGIPEEYQRSIFHPFFRVDKSRSREYGGAGLGLSLVWEISNLHGGSVWVEESSDKGTTIAVELPAGAENDSSSVDAP